MSKPLGSPFEVLWYHVTNHDRVQHTVYENIALNTAWMSHYSIIPLYVRK